MNSVFHSSNHSFIHPLIYSFIHSLIHSLSRRLTVYQLVERTRLPLRRLRPLSVDMCPLLPAGRHVRRPHLGHDVRPLLLRLRLAQRRRCGAAAAVG